MVLPTTGTYRYRRYVASLLASEMMEKTFVFEKIIFLKKIKNNCPPEVVHGVKLPILNNFLF